MYDKVCVFGCMYMNKSDRFANKLTLNVSVKSFMCVCVCVCVCVMPNYAG